MKTNPTIAMLSYHQSNGGAAIACNRLVSALRKQGALVHHLAQEGNPKEGVELTSKTPLSKVGNFIRFVLERLYFLPHEKNKSIRFLFNLGIFGKDLSKHPKVLDADVIHIHFTNFGFLSIENIAQLCRLGKPVVWTMHDMWAFTGGCHHSGTCENYISTCGLCNQFLDNPQSRDLSYKIWRKKRIAFRHSNLFFIACSNWLRIRGLKSSLLRRQLIETIPNTLDSEQIFVPMHKNEAKLALGLDPNKQLILFVAVRPNAPKKGFKEFIEAIKFLPNDASIQIGIVGNVIDQSPFEQLPFALHFFGSISEEDKMAQIYQAGDCYVTTSLEENLPNTIMEAMSCGTPCVGFKVGGIPEMIDHEKNGYLATCFDPADFSNGIKHVLAHSEEYGKEARIKVENCYTEEIVAQKHLALYKYCLSNV